jgi:hypothetical protein
VCAFLSASLPAIRYATAAAEEEEFAQVVHGQRQRRAPAGRHEAEARRRWRRPPQAVSLQQGAGPPAAPAPGLHLPLRVSQGVRAAGDAERVRPGSRGAGGGPEARVPAAHRRADPRGPVRAAAPAAHGVRAAARVAGWARGARGRPLRLLPAVQGRPARAGAARDPRPRRRHRARRLRGEPQRREDVHVPVGGGGALRRRAVRLRDEGRRRHLPPSAAAGGVAGRDAPGGHVLRRHHPLRQHGPVPGVHGRHGLRAVVGPRAVDRHLRRGAQPQRGHGGHAHRPLAQDRGQGEEPLQRQAGHPRLPQPGARGPVRARVHAHHHRRAQAQEQPEVGRGAQVLQLHGRAPAVQVLQDRLATYLSYLLP